MGASGGSSGRGWGAGHRLEQSTGVLARWGAEALLGAEGVEEPV